MSRGDGFGLIHFSGASTQNRIKAFTVRAEKTLVHRIYITQTESVGQCTGDRGEFKGFRFCVFAER